MTLSLSELFMRFGVALLLGILVGLEREHAMLEAKTRHYGGLRTFALVALLGCASAMLAETVTPWFLPTSFMIVGALILTTYALSALRGDKGLTTEVAGLLVFITGALVYWGHIELGAALAVAVTVLLSLKLKLHDLVARFSTDDIYATLKFGIITAIILPILPDQTFGPLDVLNPRNIWLMVVLSSGITFLGYVLLKFAGSQQGIPLAGFLGGLVSSTAVALGFSRQSRAQDPSLTPLFALGILIASSTMFPRVLVEASVVNPQLAATLAIPLLATAGTGYVICGILWWRHHTAERTEQPVTATNPFELTSALQFGVLFAVILFVAKAAQVYLGDAGVYLSSIFSGLTDVDAITLSMARLSGTAVEPAVAARAVVLAALANTAVKAGIALALGSPALRKYIAVTFGALFGVGALAAFVFIPWS
ncbi:MAG: MgtC/SapB family protein [Chloroflexi bacterium]|nr:MgtC/SapB family protein [Chloroflexota bacterium]MBU1752131.1 MgtC/SapB family protein [Chloroflexota bacterium]